VPTVTASTMIADLELANKVGCHNWLVEIIETAWSEVPTFRKPVKDVMRLNKTTTGGAASVVTLQARASPPLARKMLGLRAMETALRRAGDKREIDAEEAAPKSIRRAFCPDCGEAVDLHVNRKPRGSPRHLEHPRDARKGRACPRHYPRKVSN
jgi:hypothetical protein